MIIDDIALTLQPKIGAKLAIHLIQCFGSAENIFKLSAEQIMRESELREDIAHELIKRKYHSQAQKELHFLQKIGASAIAATSEQYPSLLKECDDYPHVIYIEGDPQILQAPMLSMVGTREATSYGRTMCMKIIEELAVMFPDLVIVSGLAFGIDVACHNAALANGLKTVAVMGTPIDKISPAHHSNIAREIVKKGGALITEFHSGSNPMGQGFIMRNRIIAGLSQGTVIVESPHKGGSLITAEMAGGYNRSVMALPGRATDFSSWGTNSLIKTMKAQMVCSARDIAMELGWENNAGQSTSSGEKLVVEFTRDQAMIMSCFKEQQILTIDEIEQTSGLNFSELSTILIALEFAEVIRALPGNRFEKI